MVATDKEAQSSSHADGLRSRQWPRFLMGPDPQLLEQLYIPGLSQAVHYDRCCAYFSSQVLAVAARGFGKLIERLKDAGDSVPKPAIRLLVNEQLDQEDLEALLTRGDLAPLIEQLLKRFKTPRTALEQNRLIMLAWLAASGWLEVRGGLMRYTQGILHTKFGILADAAGDKVAFFGSGNETGQALVQNFEELNLGTSWSEPEFVANRENRFQELWENQAPDVLTLPLPEAVQLKLIKFAPKQPPAELVMDLETARTAMLWRFIAASPYLCNGEHACDATALVEMWPHQHQVVDETAQAFPAGRLLCDEVGMGKTFEAILVSRRLLAGRGVKRALLLVPAGLTRQWQDELREKGGLIVPRYERDALFFPDGHNEPIEIAKALAQEDLLLISREWTRLEANRAVILKAPTWDLVLMDEAHSARRRGDEGDFNAATLLLQLLRELQLRRRTRSIMLMSATPMQTDPWEPWDLLAVLGVGGHWQTDFAGIRAYYDGIAKLRKKELLHPQAVEMARLATSDRAFLPAPDGKVYTERDEMTSALLNIPLAEEDTYVRWLRRGSPLGLRMHRNTRETLREYHRRGLLPVAPPSRDVQDKVFDYETPAEKECYQAITTYIDRRFEELEKEQKGKGFIMTVYRRRAASSPYSLRRSLEKRRERLETVVQKHWSAIWLQLADEDVYAVDLPDNEQDWQIDPGLPRDPAVARKEVGEIDSLLRKLEETHGADSKFDRFWEVLKQITDDGRPALVFTEYGDTLTYLRNQLRPYFGNTLGCYSGAGGQTWNGKEWVSVTKDQIRTALDSGRLKVLVCTDAASEGLNLQAASALVNYDLPWNPSRVEQRIGRIDRIGQKQPVLPIRNMFLNGSVDARVYEVLAKRCGLFTHFVGHMQPVLSLAYQALKSNVGDKQVDTLVKQIGEKATQMDTDELAASVFDSADASTPANEPHPVTRADLEYALSCLVSLQSQVRCRKTKGTPAWNISGLRKSSIQVTMDRGMLEGDNKVLPLTALSRFTHELADKLPLDGTTPLVVERWEMDAFCAVEVRWVTPPKTIAVESFGQLRELAEGWKGENTSPARLLEAHKEAQAAAKQRVLEMQTRAQAEEKAALNRQVKAATLRMRRELARTLRCGTAGDLNQALRTYLQRDDATGARYKRALQRLGGIPSWTKDELEDAGTFNSKLAQRQIDARILGSEIDAAIEDPRWVAKTIV
jgi:hypothetical protein